MTKIPLMYEVIPPNANRPLQKIETNIEHLLQNLKGTSIEYINVPEITDGPTNSKEKLEPRKYAKLLQKQCDGRYQFVINRVVVHEPLEVQKAWLHETASTYGITDFIFVGGASKDKIYPGPSVSDFSKFASEKYNVGGILIPHRNAHETGLQESDRVILKQKHGVSFFTSQVLCETEETKIFLKHYAKKLTENNLKPARFFLSFAPISGEKDLEFLMKLGVLLPQRFIFHLLEDPSKTLKRSLESALFIFSDIYHFIQQNNLNIPLGINIEYIMRHNQKASFEMVSLFEKEIQGLLTSHNNHLKQIVV